VSFLLITAILSYFMPFMAFTPSNSNFGYIEEGMEGESTAGYTFTLMWDLWLALAKSLKYSQFYVSFKGRGNRSKVVSPNDSVNKLI
jgi:hypothetical protein